MAISSSYANNARKDVGQFLVKHAGYSKKSETYFYKQGNNILTRVSFQRSRGITKLDVGITPLYIPDSLHILFATFTTVRFPPGCTLLEDDNACKANAWAERIINYLNGGILAFMESISSPHSLLDYLKNRSANDQRFAVSPIEEDQLIIFSSAYLGNISFAIEYTKTVQQKIRTEKIDNLAKKVARWDENIANLRANLPKNSYEKKRHTEEMISMLEREKKLAIGTAENNAPRTIQMYEKWIEPFTASGFNSEEYFTQIIKHNKMCLKYDKLFSSTQKWK